jgi:hypothetical protein
MILVLATMALPAAGCDSAGMPGMDHGSTPTASSTQPGMQDMPHGDGSQATTAGLTFTPATTSLPAGQQTAFTFRIVGADGKPVTAFVPELTKLMHFYLIRSDLTGFQHLHPSMAVDGTWTAPLPALQPGSYRAYTSFIATTRTGDASLVLSDRVTVAGTGTDTASATPLPPATNTTEVDGYTLTVGGNELMAGMAHRLTLAFTKDGKPVTDLQPYLDTYAHLTAIHEGDLAFAHLHPEGGANGDHGGPDLTFEAVLPMAGNWRLFIQFQTAGTLHTGAITLTVG